MPGVCGKAMAQPQCLISSLGNPQGCEQLLGLMEEAIEKLLEGCPPQGVMDLPVTTTVDTRCYDDTL